MDSTSGEKCGVKCMRGEIFGRLSLLAQTVWHGMWPRTAWNGDHNVEG